MISVNVRVPECMIESIDDFVKRGIFASRSDAIKTMIAVYQEREKTRQFFDVLNTRSREAREHPAELIPLDKLK
jgi:Arc/MetJ-type ribon-helix-helix transcriptional regulator